MNIKPIYDGGIFITQIDAHGLHPCLLYAVSCEKYGEPVSYQTDRTVDLAKLVDILLAKGCGHISGYIGRPT